MFLCEACGYVTIIPESDETVVEDTLGLYHEECMRPCNPRTGLLRRLTEEEKCGGPFGVTILDWDQIKKTVEDQGYGFARPENDEDAARSGDDSDWGQAPWGTVR